MDIAKHDARNDDELLYNHDYFSSRVNTGLAFQEREKKSCLLDDTNTHIWTHTHAIQKHIINIERERENEMSRT